MYIHIYIYICKYTISNTDFASKRTMKFTIKNLLLANVTSRKQPLWQRFKVHSLKSLHPQQISKVGCTYSRFIIKLVVSSFWRISTNLACVPWGGYDQ